MVCTENMFREHVPAGTVPRTSVNARMYVLVSTGELLNIALSQMENVHYHVLFKQWFVTDSLLSADLDKFCIDSTLQSRQDLV